MTLLIGAAVLATAIAVAGIVGRWLDHRDAARPPRTPVGARYVDAPGYPPLAHREPGQTGAAYGPMPSQIAEWESDDCLPADDTWCAWWPPGSLGQHPERMPDQPGHMTLTDIEDMHTAIGRITRAAERQQQP